MGEVATNDDIKDVDAIPLAQKGAANGVATLGADSKVPSAQLPSLDYIPLAQKGAANGVATLGADQLLSPAQLCAVQESKLSLSDTTTGNVSTTKHGFTPKAPDDIGQTLRGDGSWGRTVNPFLGRAVAATRNADTSQISFDGGLSWKASGLLPAVASWYSCVWDPYNRMMIVVTSNSTATAYSTDCGICWAAGGPGANSPWRAYYDPANKTVFAIPGGSTNGAAYTTDGGVTWSTSLSSWPAASPAFAAYTPLHKRSVVVFQNNTNCMFTTDGGITWQAGGSLPFNAASICWISRHNRLLALAAGGRGSAYSTDGGTTWIAGGDLPIISDWFGLEEDAIHGAVLALCIGDNRCYASINGGATWVMRGAIDAAPIAIRRIQFNGANARILAFGAGLASMYYTEDSGVTWIKVTPNPAVVFGYCQAAAYP